jgi:Flp pilus assembly protein TadG
MGSNATKLLPARRTGRRAATTVEVAVTLPILFLIVFAALEFARVSMILNTAVNAAYEGARRGIVPGATAEDAEAVTNQLMNAVGATGYTVTVVPTTITPDTEDVTVEVSTPIDQNGWIIARFFAGRSVGSTCTLRRDFIETVVP